MSGDLELAAEAIFLADRFGDGSDLLELEPDYAAEIARMRRNYWEVLPDADQQVETECCPRHLEGKDHYRKLARAAATRLEGLRNTVVDDAALREILAEEFKRLWESDPDRPEYQRAHIVGQAAIRAMSRVSRLEGLRDGVTITEEMVERAIAAMCAAKISDAEGPYPPLRDLIDFSGENKFWIVMRGIAQAALTAALNPDTETLEARGPDGAAP